MRTFQGIAIARGFAIGPVYQFQKVEIHIEEKVVSNPEQEIDRLEMALVVAVKQIQEVHEKEKN